MYFISTYCSPVLRMYSKYHPYMELKQMHVFCLPASQQDPCCRDLYICMFANLLRRRAFAVWRKLKLNIFVENKYLHLEIRQIHTTYVVHEDAMILWYVVKSKERYG